MKSIFWLTVSQALAVVAVPRYNEPGHATESQRVAEPTSGFVVEDHIAIVALSSFYQRDLTTCCCCGDPSAITTSSVVPSVSVITTSTISGTVSGTVQILPSPTQSPETQGTVNSALNTTGQATQGPLLSSEIPTPSTTLSSATTAPPTKSIPVQMASQDIFVPVATNAPPSQIPSRSDHPVPRLGIKHQNSPISTNKFYANFFLGSQSAPTWTHPYSLAWVKGGGVSKSWGMSIAHIEASQKVFGPNPNANPAGYFINPIGIQSIILSATELGASTTISTDSLTAFSANVNLHRSAGGDPSITFPLVQGMGFVTAIYHGQTPTIQSVVLIRTLTKVTTSPKPGVSKFTIVLEDGKTWFLYAYSPSGAALDFTVVNNGLAQATSTFDGIIQVAKNPSSGSSGEAIYDAACGAFATGVTLSGTTSGDTGTYTLSFSKDGISNTKLVMFALPHHIASLSPGTASAVTSVRLDTTTKGTATAIVADSWTMIESLPTTMGFAPWSPIPGNQLAQFSVATSAAIHAVAATEISQDMSAQSNLNSMYYSGKALNKFAQIAWTLHELLNDAPLAVSGLEKLKQAFSAFTQNRQQFPLVYEKAWGGIVSSASYTTGDGGVDFGNTYYNDHHFHYGYFILAAAMIGSLDSNWLAQNKDYINTMVRDIANPSSQDPYFPVSRNFDWYHGHSWAHGLYESFDGKDQESSSEDSMSAYALKMWGKTIGDQNLEARGNLQLAITTRALQSYYLYTSANTVQPANMIGNKVAGILFENKIDHTTYFGSNIEFVEGIHMLPLLPSSALTRTRQFVKEEWDKYFGGGKVDGVRGGWRGVLMANLALLDAKSSFDWFNNGNFDPSFLDGGASRTWYMALAAGLGGAS